MIKLLCGQVRYRQISPTVGAVPSRMLEFNSGDHKVSWAYNATNDMVDFKLEVHTSGWVGFGVTQMSTGNGVMVGFDVCTMSEAAGDPALTVVRCSNSLANI